jgi:bacterioferritin
MELSRDDVIDLLNRIVEVELSGAVRYTQYSLMVFGHARIPIMDWMREQAAESLLHATQAGDEVTTLWSCVARHRGARWDSSRIGRRYHAGAPRTRAQRHRALSTTP